MASAAFHRWDARGRPYRDAVPNADLAHNVARHGYTVYTKGNDEHMEADTPEDHTAFSATGWPRPSAFGVGHAHDIMPPTKSGLPSLARLGAQIVKDKNAKVPGTECIKYINWTDEDGDCWHDSWQPTYQRERSNDRGHNHISVRSDMDTTHTTYDPVARVLGDDMSPAQEQLLKDIAFIARNAMFPDGHRGRVDQALGEWATVVTAQANVIKELAVRPPVTQEELATIIAAASAAARAEVGDALRAGADAVDPAV